LRQWTATMYERQILWFMTIVVKLVVLAVW
jgi:hypothetical protein